MRIVNIGSLNIDKVYNVDHFVAAGETILATGYETFCGGKGLNQSIALARAGAEVYHAGAVGSDGDMLLEALEGSGVDTRYLQKLDGDSGVALIQLAPDGQNCILVHNGANGRVTTEYISEVLAHFDEGDVLLMQNEMPHVAHAMRAAKARGMMVAFNPSPANEALEGYPLELVDYLILNEVEGASLGRCEVEDEVLEKLCERFPKAHIVLTVGKDGAFYKRGSVQCHHGIYEVEVADTTAAGDTFTGYFLTCVTKGYTPEKALEMASRASCLAVSRKGAGVSIPAWDEVAGANLYPKEVTD